MNKNKMPLLSISNRSPTCRGVENRFLLPKEMPIKKESKLAESQ